MMTRDEALENVASIGQHDIGGVYTADDFQSHKELAAEVKRLIEENERVQEEVEYFKTCSHYRAWKKEKAHAEAAEKENGELRLEVETQIAFKEAAANERDEALRQWQAATHELERIIRERDELRERLKAAEDVIAVVKSCQHPTLCSMPVAIDIAVAKYEAWRK